MWEDLAVEVGVPKYDINQIGVLEGNASEGSTTLKMVDPLAIGTIAACIYFVEVGGDRLPVKPGRTETKAMTNEGKITLINPIGKTYKAGTEVYQSVAHRLLGAQRMP